MTPRRPRAVRAAVLVALGTVLLAISGCTGVPASSAPQTIKPVPLGDDNGLPAISPAAGIAPRELVQDFLRVNSIEPGRHTSARTFLTDAARSRWSDTSATIIDGEVVGTYRDGKPVVVRGRIVGTLNASGVYTPSLQGIGDGGDSAVFEYRVKQVGGQYRIDSLRKGLLLTTDQFQRAYEQHALYFYDLDGRYLVPDQRWSGLEGTALEQWLVTQLAAGPRPDLQTAVNSDTLPTQATSRTVSVKQGNITSVEIRGARQLDSAARNQLAAQVSYTLNDAVAGGPLQITDSGTHVIVPATNNAEFTVTSFDTATGPSTPRADVYYLRNGKVISDTGSALAGPVNNGTYFLNSVGLERTGSSATLNVAGVVGTGAAERLVVGTQRTGLHPTSLLGSMSRPAWVPGSSEVWVGVGRRLYRTTVGGDGKPTKPQTITVPSTAAGEQIVSLRVSPEGSRVAMVLASVNGAKQLFLGTVVRSAGQVRIDTLTPVSPIDVIVTDVAWIGSPPITGCSSCLKLFAIGYNRGSQDSKVFETNVDGSLWSAREFTLPDPPDSVTVTAGQLAWVSSGGFVWLQNGSSGWNSPGPESQTVGSAPAYLE